MTRLIRHTSFNWKLETESRAEVWERIKTHVQQDLDRIHAEYIHDRQIARRRAQSQYARNQQLVLEAEQGASIGDLARRFGLKHQRVRELMRTGRRWLTRNGPGRISGEDRHPAQHGPASDRQVENAVPHTMTVMSDP